LVTALLEGKASRFGLAVKEFGGLDNYSRTNLATNVGLSAILVLP
jgi:hypothetical protein